MDTCPRCLLTDQVQRANAIVETGAQPLTGLLWCPAPPSVPTRIRAFRACIAIGAVGTLAAVGSTANVQTQQDADAAWFGGLILPFTFVLLIVGFILMATSGKARREWAATKQLHGMVKQLWPQLDYCHRCGVVFMAGGSWATDPVHASRFLWDAADHTLRTRAPRPPET